MGNLDDIAHNALGGGTTKEVVYLLHILKTLDTVQSCFDKGSNDEVQLQRFSLLVQYLQSTVLSKSKRDAIEKEMREEETRLKKANKYDDVFIEYSVGFIVVREVMQYLNDIVEFEHTDIIGLVNFPKDIVPDKELLDEERDESDTECQLPDYPEEGEIDGEE
jgi:hypothetical protein